MIEDKVNAPACEQANELIAFLYGELTDLEAHTFQAHLRDCSSCNGELAAFGSVRNSVVAWRDESLAGIYSAAGARYGVAATVAQKRPSALAAMREFFNLSPLWMKGAVAFATVLFCVLAGLAAARLRTTATVPVVNNSDGRVKAYSDQQLNALVEQRVQDELRRLGNSDEQSPAPQAVADHPASRVPNRRLPTRGNEMAAISPARRPLSKVEREQLAADLRLVVSLNNESEIELLDDRINQ
jgi:hypothetical protein